MAVSSFFSRKSLLLTAVAGIVIILLAILPENTGFVKRLKVFATAIPSQADSMNIAYRRQQRYGTEYKIAMQITTAVKQSHYRGTPLVLLQPNTYFRAQKMDMNLPEPAVFYNYTGLHTIWKNSSMVKAATHIAEITPAGIKVSVVSHDTAAISAFLTRYAPFDIAL